MTADELVEPYEQNPVAAASRFDGKMVEVTGTLREFETINACSDGKERAKLYACASYPAARLNIREEGQWMFGRSVCCFNPTDDPVEKESLSRIERGQQVRVRGVVAGFAAYATSVVLYDCSIRL
ncbi:MAG: hypothetical protein HY907_06010 [Deltaproteobacteria bacterium]|nr:hypothetical protein [Deltaproteobacteria bacterium]